MVLFKLITFLDLSNILGSETKTDPLVLNNEYMDIEDILSKNAIVIDKTTGQIIMGKNYNKKIHPASMTKVMTAIVGIENVSNLNKRTKITNEAMEKACEHINKTVLVESEEHEFFMFKEFYKIVLKEINYPHINNEIIELLAKDNVYND